MKFSSEKTRLLIAERQLTIDELSKLANMPLITLSQVLNRKRNPTLKTIGKIANGLRVSVTEILAEEATDNA